MPRPEWIEVGRISRPHGVHGEVRVLLSSDNPERFLPGATLYARPGRTGLAGPRLQEQTSLTVESVRGDEDFPIVAFREVADRDRAEAVCGYVLEVRSTELPELDEDEYYPFDLAGLEARDPNGQVIGRVTEALESPAHAILVVALEDGGEALVPFVRAAVPVVVLEAGYLVVEPGLASIAGAPVEGDPS
jgi:16S rRNA processing protein RimM